MVATADDRLAEFRRLKRLEQFRAAKAGQAAPPPEAPAERPRVQDVDAGQTVEKKHGMFTDPLTGAFMHPNVEAAINIGKGAGRTVLHDLPDFVLNTPLKALNYIGEKTGLYDNRREEIKAPEAVSGFIRRHTAPSGEDTGLNRAAYTAGQWAAPLGRLTKADVAMGAGAAGGEAAGRELTERGVVGEGAEDIGELAGGIIGLLRGQPNPNPYTIQSRSQFTGGFDAPVPITEADKWDEKAGRFIMSYTANPDLAMRNIKSGIAAGDVGTSSQLAGDLGIANIEKSIPKGTQGAVDLQDIQQARGLQQRERMAEVGSQAAPEGAQTAAGSVLKQARERLQERVARPVAQQEARTAPIIDATVADEAAAQGRLQKAVQAAEEARASSLGKGQVLPVSKASENLAKAVDESAGAYVEDVRAPAWKALKEVPPEDTHPLTAAIYNPILSIHADDPIAAGRLIKKYGAKLDELLSLGEKAKPHQVNTVLSDLKGELRAKRDATTGEAYGSAEHNLDRVVRSVDDYLRNQAPSSREFQKAMEATRTEKTLYESGQVGKARRKDPELMAKGWKTTGPEGRVTLRELEAIDDPSVYMAMESRLLSEAREAPDLRKYIDDREELFEGFGRVRQQLEDVVAAEKTAGRVGEEATASIRNSEKERGRLIKSVQEKEAAAAKKLAGLSKTLAQRDVSQFATKPDETMKKIFADGDQRERRLQNLINRIDAEGGGDALRAALRDRFLKEVAPVRTGKPVVSGKSADRFAELAPMLEQTGAMTADELADIWTQVTRGLDDEALRKASASLKQSKNATEMTNLIASIATVAVSPAFGAKQSLILNGAIRRAFRRALEDRKHAPELMDAVERLLKDPEALARLEPYIVPQLREGMTARDTASLGSKVVEHMFTLLKPAAIATATDED